MKNDRLDAKFLESAVQVEPERTRLITSHHVTGELLLFNHKEHELLIGHLPHGLRSRPADLTVRPVILGVGVNAGSAGILTLESSLNAMHPWGETWVSDYGNALYRSEVLQCFWKLLNQLDEKSSVSVGFAPALLPALHGSWVGTDCAGKEGA